MQNMKPSANFGDLVSVVGYGSRVFLVDAYSVQFHHEPGKSYSEIIYDLSCPFTFEFIISDAKEITVVCRKTQVKAYLDEMIPYTHDAPKDYPQIKLEVISSTDVKASVKSRQVEIDELLDELITLQIVIDICGSDEDYAVRVHEVRRKLKEATTCE